MNSNPVGITTTTQTIPPGVEESRVFNLTLKLPPLNQLKLVVEEMQKAVATVREEHREEVRKALALWKEKFFSSYKIDSLLDEEKLKAAHALLFLSASHIEYWMVNYVDRVDEKVRWLKFSNEIKELVKALLPPTIDSTDFIEKDVKMQLEMSARYKTANLIRELMPLLESTYKRIEQELYSRVNGVNRELQLEFEETKKVAEILNLERAASIGKLHSSLEKITGEVTALYQQLEGQLYDADQLGREIEENQEKMVEIMKDCEDLLKKCSR